MLVEVSDIIIVLMVFTIIVAFALFAYRNFTQRILYEKNVQHQLEIQHQKDITESCIKIQEEERERIAVKLHDDISNKLNVLSVWLNNPITWTKKESKDLVVQQLPVLIESTRSISHSLFPVNLERFGLIHAIEELIMNVDPSLAIEFTLSSDYSSKDITIEVQLYRIIQEFLNNVIKHSNATKMIIKVRDSEKALALSLSDNGKGFDISKTPKGMGLRNITMRIHAINAIHKWSSKISKGSNLIILIPEQ